MPHNGEYSVPLYNNLTVQMKLKNEDVSRICSISHEYKERNTYVECIAKNKQQFTEIVSPDREIILG